MKVVVYYPSYNSKLHLIMQIVAQGIPGADLRPQGRYKPADVAVVFGHVKKAYPPTHSKQEIFDHHQGRSLLMVESAFIKRGDYYQVGWGGTAGHADFRTGPATPFDRWQKLKVVWRAWRRKPKGPIVVCGQLPRDTQVQDVDHLAWCRETVEYYADRGERVWFRPHPRVDSPDEYGVPVEFINTDKLATVLKVARCFVTWNSTSGVDAAVAGVPVIAMDRGSMAYAVASHDLDDLDHTPNRIEWLSGLGYSQWTLDEIRAGKAWKWLTRPE